MGRIVRGVSINTDDDGRGGNWPPRLLSLVSTVLLAQRTAERRLECGVERKFMLASLPHETVFVSVSCG
jgi:hypothetical protein